VLDVSDIVVLPVDIFFARNAVSSVSSDAAIAIRMTWLPAGRKIRVLKCVRKYIQSCTTVRYTLWEFTACHKYKFVCEK
jgi:hypothetical protein